jgi:hypothetical protein
MKISKRVAQDRGRLLRISRNERVWCLRFVVIGEEDEFVVYERGDVPESFARLGARQRIQKLFKAKPDQIIYVSAELEG